METKLSIAMVVMMAAACALAEITINVSAKAMQNGWDGGTATVLRYRDMDDGF